MRNLNKKYRGKFHQQNMRNGREKIPGTEDIIAKNEYTKENVKLETFLTEKG